MLNISEIVAKTEAMFDLFNAHFYNSELQRPAKVFDLAVLDTQYQAAV